MWLLDPSPVFYPQDSSYPALWRGDDLIYTFPSIQRLPCVVLTLVANPEAWREMNLNPIHNLHASRYKPFKHASKLMKI